MLDDLFQSVFLCALLLFWLCVYHGIRVQVSRAEEVGHRPPGRPLLLVPGGTYPVSSLVVKNARFVEMT